MFGKKGVRVDVLKCHFLVERYFSEVDFVLMFGRMLKEKIRFLIDRKVFLDLLDTLFGVCLDLRKYDFSSLEKVKRIRIWEGNLEVWLEKEKVVNVNFSEDLRSDNFLWSWGEKSIFFFWIWVVKKTHYKNSFVGWSFLFKLVDFSSLTFVEFSMKFHFFL